ncbi:hypothetical protein [Staphylococcus epidermidis]|uniref:hypothetical protein n=1 Tax=Staphylococcus epidermidis TaxID=1282 RepID=UPI00128D4BA8|nr:hypothetical protein [Staphylococcus epidermidis]
MGFGAPTKRISPRNSTDKASWGSGPQQREFHREIPRTRQVGVRGLNKENFTEKFHGQGKLGFGASTKRISPRNSTDKASWGSGPQQREFHREIPRTRQVGVRGLNKENFTEKFHGQGKLGFGASTKRISPRNSTDKASWGSGPQQREFHREIPRTRQVGVRGLNKENFTEKFHGQGKLGFGASTKRISPRNSTDKASWGSGPQQREFHREIPRTRQVGVRGLNKENFTEKFHGQGKLGFGASTKRISPRNSTDKASWGSGPQQREFHREIPRTRQVGVRGLNKENFTEKFHGQGKLSVTWITYSK